MKKRIERVETGVPNLDRLLGGGIPVGSLVVISGAPGSGKTILAQQICFHNVSPGARILYFGTLSEPIAKTLRYASQFSFVTPTAGSGIQFVDVGSVLRDGGIDEAAKLLIEEIKRAKPTIVVIDSFKVFDDLSGSRGELRKLGYLLAVHLMVWETTALLLGEYGAGEMAHNPLFSISDGLLVLGQHDLAGEHQRFLQITKMRGTDHSREAHPFAITGDGIEVFSARTTVQREDARDRQEPRLQTHVSRLDEILGGGIPIGSSLLVAGAAGTGKSVLLLEFLYRGARMGERGILFSFDQTESQLRAAARGFGWNLDAEIERDLVEIVYFPQPDVSIESHLQKIQQHVMASGAHRIAIDSVSVFLDRIKEPQLAREKVYQLATIIQNARAVAFLAIDVPYGATQISRLGVEETAVDGVILLTMNEDGHGRERCIEIYKLRNTAHFEGRHDLEIGKGGVNIYPRYHDVEEAPPLVATRRMHTGVPGFDRILGGGLLERSVTLVSGSAGIGKSTLALQFLAEGAKQQEPGLYVSLEEPPEQIRGLAEARSLRLTDVDIMYVAPQRYRASQFLAIVSERIRMQGAHRVVIDGARNLVPPERCAAELMPTLALLVARLRQLGVTAMLTLEATELHASETITEYRVSAVADNLVMMRYETIGGTFAPRITVVKTRGTAHDSATHEVTNTKHGIEIGPPIATRGKRALSHRR